MLTFLRDSVPLRVSPQRDSVPHRDSVPQRDSVIPAQAGI